MALTAWDVWRRIPPKQRKLLLAQARAHGPTIAKHGGRLAKSAYDARRKRPK
jgi:hypothetical protein